MIHLKWEQVSVGSIVQDDNSTWKWRKWPYILCFCHYLQYHLWENTKRNIFKRTALADSFSAFHTLILCSFLIQPHSQLLHCFGGNGTGLLGNTTHICLFFLQIFFSISLCNRKDVGSFSDSNEANQPSGWQHHAFVT